ncbi:MAG: hypothetical protein ACQCN6_10095 [Candidatus Bathyarchaeia archaeon]|jgi:hypothetical protein
MQTKIFLAITALAILAAALIGVTAAQYATQTPTSTAPSSQIEAPCVTGNNNQYCPNSTTGEPYCFNNGTQTGLGCGWNGCGSGNNQNGYGYCYEEQNQYQYGVGNGRNGCGGCR